MRRDTLNARMGAITASLLKEKEPPLLIIGYTAADVAYGDGVFESEDGSRQFSKELMTTEDMIDLAKERPIAFIQWRCNVIGIYQVPDDLWVSNAKIQLEAEKRKNPVPFDSGMQQIKV